MKYSEYNGIRKLLESDVAVSYGYDINEWDSLKPNEKLEQLEVINEGIGLLAGLLGGLLGLGLAFRKKVVSLGVKKIYLRQLTKIANDFKISSLNGLNKALSPYLKTKNNIKANLKNTEKLSKEQRKNYNSQINDLEKKIYSILISYITKIKDLKTQQVNKKIEGSKRLSESHKNALRYVWETLAVEVETGLVSTMVEKKIIETPPLINKIKNAAKIKNEISSKKLKTAWEKIKTEEKSGKSNNDNPKVGDKYMITHEQLGGEKECEITESSPKLIKVNLSGEETYFNITPDNFKKLKKRKIEDSKKPEQKGGEGEIRDNEI